MKGQGVGEKTQVRVGMNVGVQGFCINSSKHLDLATEGRVAHHGTLFRHFERVRRIAVVRSSGLPRSSRLVGHMGVWSESRSREQRNRRQ